jgi:hypothetical protein
MTGEGLALISTPKGKPMSGRKRRLLALLFAAVLAPLSVFAFSGPASADVETFSIKTYGSEACLGENSANTIRIDLSACAGTSYQRWYTTRVADGSYQFQNTNDGRCLFDYFGAAITVGGLSCDSSVVSDSWQNIAPPASFAVLRNEYTGNCMSHGVSNSKGTVAIPVACNVNDIGQRWNLRT